ncbi:LysR family transcriptional regulator [uncultured Roseobacter sp.]|uniref:LysR family transcriptional regulator n=1 Tax=uncultured Roseobacter sp. TaxID=114847 RepID=UPI002606DBC6|nr:LysR family transcriptional regulator [uncultured Roseobacter sp.]
MTYRLPSLNSLRAFEAAGRHLSFKTAADELGLTPGAVSQQVKKLEASLGVPLFRRLPQGLLMTAEGEAYLPDVTQVFEDLTRATEAIAPGINSKKFRVGLAPAVRRLLPDAWPQHCETLKHHVRDLVETSDVERVRRNEIDCLIRPGGGPYGALALVILPGGGAGEDLHFICRPGLADCAQSKAILRDLTRQVAAVS